MLDESIAKLRREFMRRELDKRTVDSNPLIQFREWYEAALKSNVLEPSAMTLATTSHDGYPSARIVLLKDYDERGFQFFTNYDSRKAEELKVNPRAALLLFWGELERQVRIEGVIELASREESEAYFRTRPFDSRLGAWASHQSEVIPDRATLEQTVADLRKKFADGNVPLPPFWGGFRLRPSVMEFWQGRENRLHDRIRYTQKDDLWVIERLAP